MDYVLSSGENDDFFPYGLSLSDEAWARFSIGPLVSQTDELAAHGQAHFSRMLSKAINEIEASVASGLPPARPGELMALMLLHEVYRHVIALHTRRNYPGMLSRGLQYVRGHLEERRADSVVEEFVRFYPPRRLRQSDMTVSDYLSGVSFEQPNTERVLSEMVILHVDHENPALSAYKPLYDNERLNAKVPLRRFMERLDYWLKEQPVVPQTSLTLMDMLREPIRLHPDSIEAQLEFIMKRWRALLPETLFERWLITRGVLREETAFRGLGPGPFHAPVFGAEDYAEPEAFSRDEDWMPNVVLLAKLAYVWLDQLSGKYGRRLAYLSDIPDEELDQLARWGFNGLWLIGVWERSSASRAIKQRMGNVEAAASAYSLYDYTIAQDLGGEPALNDLARRAARRGIRLAGDMVPNHMGIYSKWVIEHPERFLSLSHPPFPGYRFDGPDLSEDGRVGLFIENGYWTHSDAAVVFKRTDNWTGATSYIYHGNDGTSMPWNDTAQLNFLREDTREAVIQTIIQVARRFPIIRFDAAMTLAKRHYQRLWFPKPGDGGAIPSRAEFGMSKPDFDQVFPLEFWREVVDRIAREAPNTLLLAEAFWLMEGYFVRTLGMHRVYNSAFMNMLKMEDNCKYRQTIKNVLEFTPEVLQRFVNFMNNPDEDTAEAQFGKGDKYFGVAALLATMPGLPMFGHGQIEGFTEKYGMEYRRAYKDESPEQAFIERHEREIFPLMRKRYLFSGARHFAFYDFLTPDGWVDENVFAYSNRFEGEHAFIVYNNAFTETQGVLHTSTAINVGKGDEKILEQRALKEALGLEADSRAYVVWRDERTKLEYLHHNQTLAENGLHLHLHAYECKTFILARKVLDLDGSWGRLHGILGGAGVPSVNEAYLEMNLAGILEPFRAFMCAEMLQYVLSDADARKPLGPWRDKLTDFLDAVNSFTGNQADVTAALEVVETDVRNCMKIMKSSNGHDLPDDVRQYLEANLPASLKDAEAVGRFWRVPLAFLLMRGMGEMAVSPPGTSASGLPVLTSAPAAAPNDIAAGTVNSVVVRQREIAVSGWMQEWLLTKHIALAFESMEGDSWQAWQDARLVGACLAHRAHVPALENAIWGPVLHAMFENQEMHDLLLINWHADRRWVNKEQLERMLFMLFLGNVLTIEPLSSETREQVVASYEVIQDMLQTASDTGYDLNWMLTALK